MAPWDPAMLPRATRDEARLKADLDTYGYCLIEDAIDADGLTAVKERLAEQAAAEQQKGHHRRSEVQDPAGINQWVHMLLNKGAAFQKLLFQPQIIAMLEHLFGDSHILSDFSAHITRPGNSLLPLHIDQWWLPPPRMPGEAHIRSGTIKRGSVIVHEGPPQPSKTPINAPVVANAMWMISDYTQANGATRLVPGSHLSGAQPAQTIPHSTPSIAAEGRAGTVVMWDGRTWHAAGANTSDQPRYGVTSYYSAPQFRSLTNWTLGTKQAVLDKASPELLTLLGFKPFGSYGQTGEKNGDFARPAAELIGEL